MANVATAQRSEARRLAVSVRASIDVVCAVVLFIVFALNFGAYRVFGDGTDYYSFVQQLFGDRSRGSGYNFGTGLLNAPFYGAAHLVRAIVGAESSIGSHVLPGSITIASISFVAASMTACAWLLRRLDVPHRGLAVGTAVFGSPLWYYASFSPSYTHAADAAVFTAATIALWQTLARGTRGWLLAFAALLGIAVTVRPFNAGVVLGAVVALLALRQVGAAIVVALGSVVTFGILVAIPLSLGDSLRQRVSGARVAGSADFGFAPLTPFRMLFTEHRGLFVWTPLTLIGVAGFVLLLARRKSDRPFLITCASMAVGLLAVHSALVWWDGGWSFGMRYLSSLLPLYALGIGAFLAAAGGARRPAAIAAVVACTLWSIFLGMNHAFGATQSDGAIGVAVKRSPGAFIRLTWSYSRVRHLVDRTGWHR